MKHVKRQTKRAEFRAFAYEADIVRDYDYLLHLPNGETACLSYVEDQGPTLSIVMWPGENKTYIEARNQGQYEHVDEMR